MNLWRSSSLHPGWPMPVGPLRVPAGLVRLRPVRLRDASQWSRIRLADRAHLEPWEPVTDVNWEVRHAISSWPSVCSGLRSEARKGRMLPYVIEVDGRVLRPADHRQRDTRRAAVGVDRLLGGQHGYRGRGGDGRAGTGPRPLLRAGHAAPRRGDGASGECGEPRGAGKGRLPRGRTVAALSRGRRRVARSPAGGASPRRSSTARRRRHWCARVTRPGPDERPAKRFSLLPM